MIDTGQILSTADLEQQRRNRIRCHNDPIIIELRRQIRIQRNRIYCNEENLVIYDKKVEIDAQRKLRIFKRKLNRRIREMT